MFFVVLFLLGIVASFVNMLAGGGSTIILGYMMLMGIEPAVANATNRVGVLISCGSGAAAFRSENFTDIKQSLKLGLCALPGAILGSLISVRIKNDMFELILTMVMIFIVISMFIPKKKIDKTTNILNGKLIYPAMVFVGLYGGFVQVGVGLIIAASLRHLSSMDLLKMSMHRVFIVFIYTIPVIVVFIFSGKINWLYALVLSAGNALGSWLTVKLALKKGEIIVKIGLAITIGLMSVKLLFF
ncbi:MAG: sulfite exporter TauE/SafE family protein [Spirochaetaceae bacterium]